VENWQDMRPGTPCIAILNVVDDFVFKLVTLQKDGAFILQSLNPLYAPYTVAAGEVLELWKFHLLHTRELPGPVTELQELKQMFSELKQEIKSLKK
jgi:hypothetical protein